MTVWLLIGLAIVCYLLLRYQRQLRVSRKYLPSSTPKTQAANFKYRLLHYSPSLSSEAQSFGLFQNGNEYWIVHAQNYTSPSGIVNLRDLYPPFKGRPTGMVVIPGTQFAGCSFVVFSSDGKVYNPFTQSHPWRRDFFNLPQTDPISVDGRALSTGVIKGQLQTGTSPSSILFRFYYTSHYIEESGCSVSTDANTSGTKPLSCPTRRVEFPHPNFNVKSYYSYAGVLYAVSSDGYIYSLETVPFSDSQWIRYLDWTTLFSGLTIPNAIPITPTDTAKFYLMGADYDRGVPVFLIYENGVRYLVDRSARKYDFTKALMQAGVGISGNPLDMTKAGPGEFDYVVLYTDGNLYGPSLKGYKKSVSTFEALYPSVAGDELISITSLSKYQTESLDTSQYLTQFYLVFLYRSGKWFEVQYDLAGDLIGQLGQTDQSSGKWTEWSHVKSMPPLQPGHAGQPGQTIKFSSFGWSVFVFDPNNRENDLVYSLNNPPEKWIDMLLCTTTGDKFKSSTCVGVGGWKEYQYSQQAAAVQVVGDFKVYPETGVDFARTPGRVLPKVSQEVCSAQPEPVLVYDSTESDCHAYAQLSKRESLSDRAQTTQVRTEYDPAYQNRFCLKHLPSSKYLVWDFTNPDQQQLSLQDECIYTGNPQILHETNPDPADVKKLQLSLGSMWSFDSGSLLNLNHAVGGYLDTTNMSLVPTSKGDLQFSGGALGDYTRGKCFHAQASTQGGTFTVDDKCTSAEWAPESIPCPNFVQGGYISQYCQVQQ